jgi:hypothetical protein
MAYIRRIGVDTDVIDRSLSMEDAHLKAVVKAVKSMRTTGRNDLGIALGVIRSLRDNKLLDMSKFTSQDS